MPKDVNNQSDQTWVKDGASTKIAFKVTWRTVSASSISGSILVAQFHSRYRYGKLKRKASPGGQVGEHQTKDNCIETLRA